MGNSVGLYDTQLTDGNGFLTPLTTSSYNSNSNTHTYTYTHTHAHEHTLSLIISFYLFYSLFLSYSFILFTLFLHSFFLSLLLFISFLLFHSIFSLFTLFLHSFFLCYSLFYALSLSLSFSPFPRLSFLSLLSHSYLSPLSASLTLSFSFLSLSLLSELRHSFWTLAIEPRNHFFFNRRILKLNLNEYICFY